MISSESVKQSKYLVRTLPIRLSFRDVHPFVHSGKSPSCFYGSNRSHSALLRMTGLIPSLLAIFLLSAAQESFSSLPFAVVVTLSFSGDA